MAKALWILVLVAGLTQTAWATTEIGATFDEMVAGSQLIVHGRVVDARGQAIDGRRSIETVVTVAVAAALKGQPGTTVTFRTPGGELGRYRRVTVGAPSFASGDEVILFLRGAAPALPTVFGLSQGVFRVMRAADGTAVVAAPVTAAGADAVRVVRGDPARRPLTVDAFSREVRIRLGVTP
jgi:hypothetical protein